MARRVQVKAYMGSRYSLSGHNASATALRSNFKLQMQGLLGAFNQFVEGVNNVVPEILEEALAPTFAKAMAYAPIDTGDLRASGYLQVESSARRHQVAIGFGRGNSPDYAIYVHEMPYAHKAPTRWKFLEAALDEDFRAFTAAVPRLLKEAAGT